MSEVVMRARLTLVLLVLAFAAFSPAGAFGESLAFDVGGVTIRFSPKPGWCVYPKETLQTALDRFYRADQTNVAHTFFGDCRQVAAAAQSQTRIHDYGYFVTPRKYLTSNPGSRSQFVKIMSDALKAQDPYPDLTSILDKLNKAELGFQIGEMRPLGFIDEDQYAVYSGAIQSLTVGSEQFQQVGVWGLTVVNGRMVFSYVYSDFVDESSVLTVIASAKSQVARLIQANP
jgi:hypothetical protein